MRVVTLTKLSDNKNNLRSNEVKGILIREPKVKDSIVIFSQPIDGEKDYRQIVTSAIQSINKVDEYTTIVKTMNSEYELKFIQEN